MSWRKGRRGSREGARRGWPVLLAIYLNWLAVDLDQWIHSLKILLINLQQGLGPNFRDLCLGCQSAYAV